MRKYLDNAKKMQQADKKRKRQVIPLLMTHHIIQMPKIERKKNYTSL